MDKSRRASNPDNYNTDGTVKKKAHRKPWKNSKYYNHLIIITCCGNLEKPTVKSMHT